MREIKLSLKDARKRGEKVGNQPAVITSAKNEFGQPIIEPGRGGEELDLEPTRGWTQAPDLAMLKSRPVDPPRERDIKALRKAAFEPGSTPEKPIPKRGRTDDDCLREKFGGLPKALADGLKRAAPAPAPVADSAVGEWPKWYRNDRLGLVARFDGPSKGRSWRNDGKFWDWSTVDAISERVPIAESEAFAWLESHGHAQVAAELRAKATSVLPVAPELGEFEPVGTPWRVGDVVYNERDQYWYTFKGAAPETLRDLSNNEIAAGFKFCTVNGRSFSSQDAGEKNGWRILKRKNVAARAWKDGNHFWVKLGDRWFYSAKAFPWKEFFPRGLGYQDHLPNVGYVELTDPAEIQRLVDALHAAGLGK